MSGALRSCEDTMTVIDKQQGPVSGTASDSSSISVHPVSNDGEQQQLAQSAVLVGNERAPLLKGLSENCVDCSPLLRSNSTAATTAVVMAMFFFDWPGHFCHRSDVTDRSG